MNKLKILLAILVVANIIFASILVADVQMFESPDILVEVELIEINSNEILLGTNIKISNPNSFDLTVSDLEILSETKAGEKIGNIIIDGGKIASNSEKSFSSVDKLSFKSIDIYEIENTVSAKVGINVLGFITKTIPLEISAIVSFDNLVNDLDSPKVNINFDFEKVTEKGLNFSVSLDVYNPNDFDLNINSLSLDFSSEKNIDVGNMEITGGVVKSKEYKEFLSNGTIDFNALDAEVLYANISGIGGLKIAGVNKNISISANANFNIPDIKSFIFEDENIDISLPVQFRFTYSGLMSTVGLKIYNPSDIPLVAENLVCSISRLDGEKTYVLGSENMELCNISPHKTICIKTQILIPYMKYLFSGSKKLLPEWLILNIEGDFSIAGTRQSFPLSISAYVDPHFFRNSELIDAEVK